MYNCTLLTTPLSTVSLPARTSPPKMTALCFSFFCPCSFPPLPMLRESRPHSGCLACTESLAESPVARSRSRLHNVGIYSDILAVTATPPALKSAISLQSSPPSQALHFAMNSPSVQTLLEESCERSSKEHTSNM